MSFAIVAGAAIGVVGSVVASNSASSASRDASNAATNTAAADRQLARETRDKNEALFAQYLQDENLARAYADALFVGQGSVGSSTTRPMTEAEISQAYPDLYTQWLNTPTGPQGNLRPTLWTFLERNGITTSAPGAPSQVITREQVLAQIEGTPLAQMANTDFAAREDLADETYAGANALADGEYGDLRGVGDENYAAATDLADRARTGRRGVATDNLNSRLGLEEDSYAAWLPMSDEAERDAINLNFSRGGVTGLIGQTRAGVGETTQDAAMERNLRRLEGVQAAYDPYYGDVTAAENYYWGDQDGALDDRANTYLGAEELRGRRRQTSYDRYSQTRAGNYDTYAGDTQNSYAAYGDFLNDRMARGAAGRQQIAGGNSDYASAAIAANNRAGDAAAANYARQGQIQQQLYGDLADIAGGVAGSIFNRKETK